MENFVLDEYNSRQDIPAEDRHTTGTWLYALFPVIILAGAVFYILKRQQWLRIIRQKNSQLAGYCRIISSLTSKYRELQRIDKQNSALIERLTSVDEQLLSALELRVKGLKIFLTMAYTQIKPSSFFDAFRKHIKRIRADEAAFADMRYIVSKRYPGFVESLHQNYPTLTHFEIDMLCMILLGFSFDSIRFLCSHGNVDSLYSRRTKIREKLRLPPRYRLERFVAELAEQYMIKRVADVPDQT